MSSSSPGPPCAGAYSVTLEPGWSPDEKKGRPCVWSQVEVPEHNGALERPPLKQGGGAAYPRPSVEKEAGQLTVMGEGKTRGVPAVASEIRSRSRRRAPGTQDVDAHQDILAELREPAGVRSAPVGAFAWRTALTRRGKMTTGRSSIATGGPVFHDIPAQILARMHELEHRDAVDRADGTPLLERLRQVPAGTGRFLALLAASAPDGPWIEIGTSAGYSALWLSLACRATGRCLTTFEVLAPKAALAA